MRPVLLPIVVAALLGPVPALADGELSSCFRENVTGTYRSPCAVAVVYRREALAIQERARAQAAADGGALTPAHDAAVRADLAALVGRYRRQMRDADRLSVDANGRSVAAPLLYADDPRVLRALTQ